MIQAHPLRELSLPPADHPRGQSHVSSASGLALAGDYLYIVADDENHVLQLDARDAATCPIVLTPFTRGVLPDDKSKRKKRKADLESLIVFPAPGEGGAALLVAWGSASRPQREFAYVFTLDDRGAIASGPRQAPLAALCAPLQARFGTLNLEAGFVRGAHTHLFQRANQKQPLNGHIRYDTAALREWLEGTLDEPPVPLSLNDIDLGDIDGVPLGITDAAASPDGGWVFSAVAEGTGDAYEDAACVGSVIGRMDEHDRLLGMERLHGNPKVEGLAFAAPGRLWMVTDADDPSIASALLELHWPG